MSGKLYVVGTPIGNLGDFSPRAVETLESVDFIAAEDTRVTLKLLNHFGIKKEMVSYFEHNKNERGDVIISRLANGETCAICTDAGMPAISDPGEDLVKLCHENNIDVESVPGPTAFATALAISGMNTRKFTFEGFLSANKKERREELEELANEKRTMVFYEAPHKLTQTLKDMYEVFGERDIALVKEITKVHENVVRTDLKTASTMFDEEKPKGEFVVIVDGKKIEEKEISFDKAVEEAKRLMADGMSTNAAAKEVAKITLFKKNDIYKALLGFVMRARENAMLTVKIRSAIAKVPINLSLPVPLSIFGKNRVSAEKTARVRFFSAVAIWVVFFAKILTSAITARALR